MVAATTDIARPADIPRPAGATRRRGEQLLGAIYSAVLDELTEYGYQGLTIEGVAKRAQTGKAAIYRRFADRDELVTAALDHLLPKLAELPDTGSLRGDLLVVFGTMVDFFNSPAGAALQRIFADTAHADPAGAALVEIKHEVVGRRQAMLGELLERGVRRGQVRAEAVCQRVLETGPALLMGQCMVRGGTVSDDVVLSIVDDVLVPLMRT